MANRTKVLNLETQDLGRKPWQTPKIIESATHETSVKLPDVTERTFLGIDYFQSS